MALLIRKVADPSFRTFGRRVTKRALWATFPLIFFGYCNQQYLLAVHIFNLFLCGVLHQAHDGNNTEDHQHGFRNPRR